MTKFTPVVYVKFCEQERYADDFMAGTLFMNTLGYFKRLEDTSGKGRADPNEAATHWWQPSDIVMKLSSKASESRFSKRLALVRR